MKGALETFNPQLVLASGVAALAAYEVFAAFPDRSNGRSLITLSAPLALWPVRSAFGGRITGLLRMRLWIDLINPQDSPLLKLCASTHRISLPFERVPSEAQSFEEYLNQATIRNQVWSWLGAPVKNRRKIAPTLPGDLFFRSITPSHRALLVGINDYPDPEHHLRGSINDIYLMSAILQEAGYHAEDIAVLTN